MQENRIHHEGTKDTKVFDNANSEVISWCTNAGA